MNIANQLASELASQGRLIPLDVACSLMDSGYDIQDNVDGFSVIDTHEIDYFEYIDQNH